MKDLGRSTASWCHPCGSFRYRATGRPRKYCSCASYSNQLCVSLIEPSPPKKKSNEDMEYLNNKHQVIQNNLFISQFEVT